MTLRWAVFAALAALAGAFIPAQTAMNAQLDRRLGDPWLTTAAVFVGSLAFILVVLALKRPLWPTGAEVAAAPWWSWAGGVLGCLYVLSLTLAAPRVGVGMATALGVLGQVVCGALIDQWGWLGAPVQAASWVKVLAVGLIGAGVILFRAG